MRKIIVSLLAFAGLTISFLSYSAPAKSIAESAEQVAPLLNGQMIPDVEVTTIDGGKESLPKFLDGQKTVLFFYRGGWCPFCNTQMGQLKAIEGQLKAMGFQLVGVSTDGPADLKKSIEKMDLGYQLVSDFDSTLSQAFGIAFFTSEKTTKRYLAGLNLANPLQKNAAGQDRLVLPAPAVYVIDSKGLVQFNYVNPNFRVRLDEQVLLAAAKAVK
ncbi:AhpC/TSA family protein [Endozoicomonas sp. G2_1]|uniref:peroxiredoxin-like family protein n=1 Tax=Endozoicomonas sp. G2_1 TaxID=2821091 RepID=UPI001ADAC3EF|nr:peroxiredoxin-like family protein [Endozoicomonas sp. G2_1]MBO9489929.1 AhpC/TSA family protein [Endozoicomonas sp. G2_1]